MTGIAGGWPGFLAGIALAVGISAAPAKADRLSVLLGSYHAGASEYDFEGLNPGLFYTWQRGGGLDYSAGVFRNSYGGVSPLALVSLDLFTWETGEIEVMAGAALYPGDGARFKLALGDLVPVVGFTLRQGRAFVQVLPGDQQSLDAVFAFGLTWELAQ